MTIIRGTRSPFRAHAAFGAGLHAWARTLAKHGAGIGPAYWPRVLAITIMITLNAPLRWWERLRFGRRVAKAVVQNPVFILGHPRSGTTYLHYVMSRDPQFAFPAVYQSLMPWTFLSAGGFLRSVLGKALPATRPMDNVKMTADAPKEEEFAMTCLGAETLVTGYFFPRELIPVFLRSVLFRDEDSKRQWQGSLLYFMRKLTVKHGPKPLLMKSPANMARVKEILELFPNARFIYIHRDPLTVYASTIRLYGKILPQQALQSVSTEAVRDFVIASYAGMRQKYMLNKSLIPNGHSVELRYEDFVGREVEQLEVAYKQLGLEGFEHARPYMQTEIDATAGYKTNEYALSDEEVALVRKCWGLD